MTSAVVVLITAANEEAAAKLAHSLVNEKLLACANIVPSVRSIYRWQGQVHDQREALLVCKTARDKIDALKLRLAELHPYDTPELLALPVEAGLDKYLAWISASVE
jgi:periplasmic divalent cation tolerance protein